MTVVSVNVESRKACVYHHSGNSLADLVYSALLFMINSLCNLNGFCVS